MTEVRAVRAFLGRRRRRSWLDWYAAAFGAVIGLIYLANFLAGPMSRLSGAAARPGALAARAAAAQAIAGTGLVIGVAAGLLLLTQALGPMTLSPADSSWLLLAPLNRRGVLRRSALTVALLGAVAGGLLGALALAMAGPYLRPGSVALPSSWLASSATAGALCCLAAVAGQALAQPHARVRAAVRAVLAAVAATALAGAVTAEGLPGLPGAVTGGFGALSTPVFDAAAIAALVLAAIAGPAAWHRLRGFPAAVLRTDSARAGRTLMAASFGNLQLLSWIAEDNHWRGRIIASRRWPRLLPSLVLAWADWRRLGRRPELLAVTAATALLPVLAGGAITGRGRHGTVAAVLLLGALGAGSQGTAALKRDLNDRALRRLLGVGGTAALTARAVLPALLAAGWLVIAFALLAAVGVLPGWLWVIAGAAAGPGAAAAALRLAGTAPIDPGDQAGMDTGAGRVPAWMIVRMLSLLLGAAGMFPVLRAVLAGHAGGSTVLAQVAVSAVVLWAYLAVAGRRA